MFRMIRNEICTERLTLRPFREGDAAAVADYWNSDPNWSRFNESVPLDHTIRDAQKFVAEMISRDREDQPSWAVLLEGRVVEQGMKSEILAPPYPDYTKLLLSSVPEMDPDWLTGLLKERAKDQPPA